MKIVSFWDQPLLKRRRQELQLTQREVAQMVSDLGTNMSQAIYQQIESKSAYRLTVRAEYLQVIAKALDLNYDDVYADFAGIEPENVRALRLIDHPEVGDGNGH